MNDKPTDRSQSSCPACGNALPSHSDIGLCPACLMKEGLVSEADSGDLDEPDSQRKQRPLPDIEEIRRNFPGFEILECLGRGGMGVVYKARQKALDRLVALKVLAPERERDAGFAQRFAREAKTLAQLNHPNIVTVYDFGESHGMFYFAMEFVDGVNVRHLISAQTLLPQEALAIVPTICDALQYAHDRGVVHRDIKPENLLLDKEGRIKIADFGIAKLMEQEATGGEEPGERRQVAGTPKYMAPEQKNTPDSIDHRVDIYSLGLVFYEMLIGELPQEALRLPSSRVPGASSDTRVRLDELVFRTMEKKPERRFQQASEVQTAVESVATEPYPEGASAPEKAPVEPQGGTKLHSETDRSAKKARPRRRLVALLGVLTIVVLAGAGYAMYPLFPHEHLYDRATMGVHSRYPLPGESYALLAKRFDGSIQEDVEDAGGRHLRILEGDCLHRVWVYDGRVEAILITPFREMIDSDAVARDFLDHSSRAGAFEPRDNDLWWNSEREAAMAIRDGRTILVATEEGMRSLMER